MSKKRPPPIALEERKKAFKRKKPETTPKTPKQWLNEILYNINIYKNRRILIYILKCGSEEKYDEIIYTIDPYESDLENFPQKLNNILDDIDSPDFSYLSLTPFEMDVKLAFSFREVTTFQDLRELLNLSVPKDYKGCEEMMDKISNAIKKYKNSKCWFLEEIKTQLQEKYRQIVHECLKPEKFEKYYLKKDYSEMIQNVYGYNYKALCKDLGDEHNLSDLKELAKIVGLEGYTLMNKTELCKALSKFLI